MARISREKMNQTHVVQQAQELLKCRDPMYSNALIKGTSMTLIDGQSLSLSDGHI